MGPYRSLKEVSGMYLKRAVVDLLTVHETISVNYRELFPIALRSSNWLVLETFSDGRWEEDRGRPREKRRPRVTTSWHAIHKQRREVASALPTERGNSSTC